MTDYDVLVIGGGPAGMAAALSARDNGAARVALLERDAYLGGILNQCVHSGFGLHYFKEELTGPEYAARFASRVASGGIDVFSDTMALSIAPDKTVTCVSPREGLRRLSCGALVLAMGCRERARGAIALPGERASGVFTAGTAQRYINIEGYMVGRRAVILGSGDIGLIMARRMTLEGAKVLACVEICPYSNGLKRNIAQCLNDFDIPLMLRHTITCIHGKSRVEGVTIAEVDENKRPIAGTERFLACDTVLLSVGLIPENELAAGAGIALDARTRGAVVYENNETCVPGVFACGNALHVHDVVDNVTLESERAGAFAAKHALGKRAQGDHLDMLAGEGVSYTVPQRVRPQHMGRACDVYLRVKAPRGACEIVVSQGEKRVCAFARGRVAPGEMEKITLPAALLDASGAPVTLSLADGKEA